jgi:glycosyltransferase involved in cell wall biosynthesis
MTAAIVHYHLRPGGVTRVIASASRALAAAGIPHVILSGSPAADDPDLPVVVLEGLDYLPAPSIPDPAVLEERVREAAARTLGSPPDIWHFHNSCLGKAPAVTGLIRRLAEAGERLVLQVHDLAEDGRPANYQRLPDTGRIHPTGSNIRYAFINSRDHDRFIAAGLPPRHARLLLNPQSLPPLPAPPPHAAESPQVFYPVRGIRRKNLGEFLLLAALAPLGARFAIASPPANAAAREIHDHWQNFARRHPLPVDFAVVDRRSPAAGLDSSFPSWLAACTHLATTSVAEGFGYAFPDSLALRKPLIGRSIPYLDHARHGSHHPGLYDHLIVPRDWINEAELFLDLADRLRTTYRLYDRPLPDEAVEQAWQAIRLPHGFDFGNLPEDIQRSCINRCIAEPHLPRVQTGSALVPADQWLADRLSPDRAPLLPPLAPSATASAAYGEALGQIYHSCLRQAGPPGWVDSSRLLDLYLAPASFHFLTAASE